MGGLAHYFEDEGLSTTQISLVREHTEIIKPPRALWVPFDLGRPFGTPNDAEFQKKVLLAALRLFGATSGPVLEDFPEDEPSFGKGAPPVACPVNFSPPGDESTGTDGLHAAFMDEIAIMRPWYDIGLEKRGRTTANTLGLEMEEISQFILDFIEGSDTKAPLSDLPQGRVLNMACEDLKAYYFEAITAQPGQTKDSSSLADWFWGRTIAAKVINEARERCLAGGREDLKIFGELLLVPRNQLHRFKR